MWGQGKDSQLGLLSAWGDFDPFIPSVMQQVFIKCSHDRHCTKRWDMALNSSGIVSVFRDLLTTYTLKKGNSIKMK